MFRAAQKSTLPTSMSRSRLWLVSWTTALLVFAVPLIVSGAMKQDAPEIRVIRTGETFSALIVTTGARVLIINSNDRGLTRSAVGRIARPWEPRATTLLAPASDEAAIGLWEALRSPRVERVLVAGVPGSDPIWSGIERDCAKRGIPLEYISTAGVVNLSDVVLMIDPAGPSIRLLSGDASVSMALGDENTFQPAHVVVVNTASSLMGNADLLVSTSVPNEGTEVPVLTVDNREMLRLVFDGSTIRLHGGTLVEADLSLN